MPRKAHTKSRYGCDNCRRRRVKCDEQGPPCRNCILHQLENCIYSRILPASLLANARRASSRLPGQPVSPLRPQAPAPVAVAAPEANSHVNAIPTVTTASATILAQPQTSESSSSGLSPNAQGHQSPQQYQIDSLELMHQFATDTYASLCVSESESHSWQRQVPRLGLRYRYLMNGILALSSLHIATTVDPSLSRVYVDKGLEYHSLSLELFRQAVDSLNPENCDALFAQSVVTTAINLALPQFGGMCENHTATARMTENIIMVFELLQGVKKILTIGQSWINLDLFLHGEYWTDTSAALDEDTSTALDELARLNEQVNANSRINANANANANTAQDDSILHQIYASVINHLRHCFMKFSVSPDPAPVLAWLGAVDKEFVKSLRRRMSFSLLILAHWGVLLGGLDGQRWWARGSGRALVSELLGALRGEDQSWELCLDWVKRRMGLGIGREVVIRPSA